MSLPVALLHALDIEKPVWSKKRAVVPLSQPQLRHTFTILQAATIERLAWVDTDFRMHTVLCVKQMDILLVILFHTRKETLLVLKPGGFAGEHSWRKLLRISHQYTFGAPVLERNQRRQFDGLSSFIDDNSLELDVEPLEYLMPATAQRCT